MAWQCFLLNIKQYAVIYVPANYRNVSIFRYVLGYFTQKLRWHGPSLGLSTRCRFCLRTILHTVHTTVQHRSPFWYHYIKVIPSCSNPATCSCQESSGAGLAILFFLLQLRQTTALLTCMKPVHCFERMVWHRIFTAEFNSIQFNFLQKNQNNVATETSVVVRSVHTMVSLPFSFNVVFLCANCYRIVWTEGLEATIIFCFQTKTASGERSFHSLRAHPDF